MVAGSKNTHSTSASTNISKIISPPPLFNLDEVKAMFTTVSTELKFRTNFEKLTQEVLTLKRKKLGWEAHVENVANFFQNTFADNNETSDIFIRKNFSTLLSGFRILQKEITRLSEDVKIMKIVTSVSDSDDENTDDQME